MRVQLKIDGGFAYVPGLTRPVIVDARTLDAGEAAELRRLCADAGAAAGAAALPDIATHPDARRYRITIESPDGRREFVAADPVTDPAIAALIAFVRRHRT